MSLIQMRHVTKSYRIFKHIASANLIDRYCVNAKTVYSPQNIKSERNMSTTSAKLISKQNMIWVDLEMSGLDVNTDHILEVACLVTNKDLKIIAEGPNLVIHQPDHVLESMGEWCKENHAKSGLTEAVRCSTLSVEDAERHLLSFVESYTLRGESPVAGNSVYTDRVFLQRHMPDFTSHLHYRVVDVSSVKELCKRWYPSAFSKMPKKKLLHRSLDDIKESIEELKYYRQHIFLPP